MRPSELTKDEYRVLSEGPADPSDYEIVQCLCDYGYTDSVCRISRMRNTRGQVLDVAWLGANTAGKLALEGRISNDTETDEARQIENGQNCGKRQTRRDNILKSLRSFFAKIASDSLTQLIVMAVIAVVALIAAHFGFSIK